MKMADELDRVRISAAELRAEASNLADLSDCHAAEQRELEGHGHHDNKHPDLRRYQPGVGHGRRRHDSEEGDATPGCQGDSMILASDSEEPVRLFQGEHEVASEPAAVRRGCTDGGMGKEDGDRGRGSGMGSNCGDPPRVQVQASETKVVGNCNRSGSSTSSSQPPAPTGRRGKEQNWNNRHHPEPVGATSTSPKPARKTRKPDREIYQPGSRRSTQGKEAGEGREQDKPPPAPAREGTRREATTQREAGEREGKRDPAPRREGGEREGRKDSAPGKEGGKGREEKAKEEKKTIVRGEETGRKPGKREAEKTAEVLSTVVENLTNRVDRLSVKEDGGKRGGEGGNEEGGGRRRKVSGEPGRRSRPGGGCGGVKEGGENPEEKKRERGNRRKRGGEKEGNQDTRRGRAEGGGGGGEKSERGMTEKERDRKERDRKASEGDREKETDRKASEGDREKETDRKASEGDREKERDRKASEGDREKETDRKASEGDREKERDRKASEGDREKERDRKASEGDRDMERSRSGDTNPPKGREKHRDRQSQRGNQARDGEREAERDRNRTRERAVEGSKANSNTMTTSSKRYSKSEIRRPRNRTYSTSSASSGTSLDGPRPGLEEDRVRRDRLGLGGRNRGGVGGDGGARRGGQLQTRRRTTREMSSTDSLEGSELGDRVDDRRRGSDGEEEWSPERRRQAENRARGQRGGGGGRGGILRVSLEKQSGASQAPSGQAEDPQRRRQGSDPCGKGRGILILPAHTSLSNSPEAGPRLLFGGIRGGGAGLGRGRGGRGGGTRRLWDPNNPDQKPALARSQPSQHSGRQQPMYLQTGGGYGPLHFLDTDDEAAGSPPVHQGDNLQTQQHQAAAMAYYKFQNSDNPYCYPMPNNNPNANVAPNPHYTYPYPISPYQNLPSNGMFPSPGMGQFYGGYRGQGYPPVGRELTPEEAEQQARGELGRLLRAADTQELQLSNLLSRDRLSSDGLDRMAQLRADLLTLYERVILTDIEFSDSQNLDQALWKNVFYQVIERFRQLLKDPAPDPGPRIRTMLLTLLDEGAVFFDALLQKLQTVFQFKLEDYMDGLAIRARPLRKTVKYALISAQRCMICQGDIARYREQASDSANYGKARNWYLKAQQIAPKNGRPYNQLALLAVYTKRKLDAVYYYMRSLAASNPILTAKESLMSLFEEAKRKADQLERRQRQESEGRSKGPMVRGGGGRGEEGARVEIWVRPSAHTGAVPSHRGGSESSRDSEQDGELGNLNASDLNKRFILSFLHGHGKLFTKVGMESFPGVASRALQEFRALLQHSPSPLGSTRMLQIITINMFTIHNAQSRDVDGDVRSVLQEQTTALGLAMFGLLVQRCTELLRETPAEPITRQDGEEGDEGEELEGMVMVSAFPLDLRDLLPSIKVWSDWMLGHPDQWNPPPSSIDGGPDVWSCLAELCNALARVDHGEAPLYKVDGDGGDGDEELRLLLLEEDRLLAGFVPLLGAPQEPCYVDRHTDTAIAADCKRVTVLKYFLEALCGQEEPLLAFKGGKYVSMATSPSLTRLTNARSRQDSQTERETDDVIVEEESSLSASEGDGDTEEGGASEDDFRELRARRHALACKLAQQQKRRDKIQEVLQTCGQLELEVRPLFLVPDTNGFIDHLEGLNTLLQSSLYILVVPLIVITELDGLAKGQESGGGGAGRGGRGAPGARAGHVKGVQEKARVAVAFLERGFEAREPCLRALTSRGSQLDSIAFRSEDTSGQLGNNDDVILSCCLHYCKDKARDFMPAQRNRPVRLRREVVLLTDDRNLRVKALTRNVPVRDIPAFLSWAKVG